MCDTIGKKVNGNTSIFGKNSDRSPNEPQVVEYYPAKTYTENTVMTTYIEVEQVKETCLENTCYNEFMIISRQGMTRYV